MQVAWGAFYKSESRSSRHGAVEMNLTRNHEVAGSIPGVKRQPCHELWCRSQAQLGSDVAVAVV